MNRPAMTGQSLQGADGRLQLRDGTMAVGPDEVLFILPPSAPVPPPAAGQAWRATRRSRVLFVAGPRGDKPKAATVGGANRNLAASPEHDGGAGPGAFPGPAGVIGAGPPDGADRRGRATCAVERVISGARAGRSRDGRPSRAESNRPRERFVTTICVREHCDLDSRATGRLGRLGRSSPSLEGWLAVAMTRLDPDRQEIGSAHPPLPFRVIRVLRSASEDGSEARTIATMPARTASGRSAHRSAMRAKLGSRRASWGTEGATCPVARCKSLTG
jgi:hypothetical protein